MNHENNIPNNVIKKIEDKRLEILKNNSELARNFVSHYDHRYFENTIERIRNDQ